MKRAAFHKILTILISLVWLINGLYAKVLGFVPRHQEIVARILGNDISFLAVKVIGALEICMFIWVISRKFSRLAAVMQIIIVMTMNVMEFILVPDLLLFGRMNIIIALVFVCVVYVNEFILKPKSA
ncbi:MAG TPA: DoxX-like family protein [Ignavibacteria bacterium]|nr:DoxX-like family protein [Ignavibacteria bacterium]HMQ97386.1 DoxX-like family protein [Ignavibacteria bacterium]